MRLVAWNLNHRIHSKPIVPAVAEAITALEPDFAILTEYVPHDSHSSFLGRLGEFGLRYVSVSDFVMKNNRVLIASRSALVPGSIRAPGIHQSVPSNALHVVIPSVGFELLGLRMPDLSKFPKARRAWWDWLETTAAEVVDRPFIIAGDFNTDATYPKARCGERLLKMVQAGWHHAAPSEGASFRTLNDEDKRIDHAFFTKNFEVRQPRYVTESAGHRLRGKPAEALSDHAALVVDFERSN